MRVSLHQVHQDIPEQSLNQGQEDDSAQGEGDRVPITGIGDKSEGQARCRGVTLVGGDHGQDRHPTAKAANRTSSLSAAIHVDAASEDVAASEQRIPTSIPIT